MPAPAPKQQTLDELLAKQSEMKKNQVQTAPTALAQQTKLVEKDFDIDNNTFAKIVFNMEIDAEEKIAQLIKAMTYDKTQTRDWNKDRHKEFQVFDEYLQRNRYEMHLELIRLTDATTVAELKEMYEKMYGGIRKYEELLQPMNDTLSAIFTLRQEGGAELQYGIYNEIEDDKIAGEKRLEQVAERELEMKGLKGMIDAGQAEIDRLSQEKKFKLFGKPSEATLDIIARKKAEIEKAKIDLDQKQADLKTLHETPIAETKFAKNAEQKEFVRRMLNISREQHIKNSEDLKTSALDFCEDSRTHGLEALGSLEEVAKRIDGLDQNNHGETNIYGFLREASVEASKANLALREEIVNPPAGENTSARITRETEVRDIEDFINVSNKTAVNTLKVISALGEEALNVMTMKASNQEVMDDVREQTTNGVATVAGGISSTLTAFNQAVISETAATLKGAAELMNGRTTLTNQSQAVQQANNVGQKAAELEKLLKQSQDTVKVLDYVAVANRQGLEMMKNTSAKMKEMSDQIRASAAKVNAVGSELDMQNTKGTAATDFDKAAAKTSNDNAAAADAAPAEPKKKADAKKGIAGFNR